MLAVIIRNYELNHVTNILKTSMKMLPLSTRR